MFYWFLKWIAIGPVLKLVFRPQVSGHGERPGDRPGDPGQQPPVVRRLAVHAADAARAGSPSSPRRSTSTPRASRAGSRRSSSPAPARCPIDRSGASAAEGALSSARKILDEGDLFGIYPEGTRSHDGKLYRGKTGVARLALECKVPVIPTAVVGTDVVAPPGQTFGKFTRPIVRFGKPLDFSRYEGMENDRYILRSITDEIMYEIMRLSGQEYVDQYASRAKEEGKRLEAEEKAAAEAREIEDELRGQAKAS